MAASPTHGTDWNSPTRAAANTPATAAGSALAIASGTFKAPDHDLQFDARDFERIRSLIYQRAGIVIGQHKRDMVYSRIGRRLRHHHMTSFGDYLSRLEGHPQAREWQEFVNSLTTNLTAFFRESHHFPLLGQHVAGRSGPIRVWSSAASTGEEPYSIAMQLLETLGPDADVEVLGTDIDTHALEVARCGVYSIKLTGRMDATRRNRFFQKGSGSHAGHVRIRAGLARHVTFRQLNLVGANWDVGGPFDAIFCRNTMIYFDTKTQQAILERFARVLKPDGLLFAGHSESFSYITKRFRLRGQTVYTLA